MVAHMLHLPGIIQDLALILITASVVTVIFKLIRQPVVLGYIIAGLLVSPNIPLLPSIKAVSSVQDWGEIGVIFLLFALGLEFSFKRLARVGGAASITAIFEVVVMMALGFATGEALGWSQMDSIFLGGVLAISSTTIIIRAFDEVGVKGRGFVQLVFGVLVVEDLVAVVLLALLSTIAATRQFAGLELTFSLLKLVFFLIIWFLSGIFLIPTLLKKLRPLINEETLVIMSIGLCFLMVVSATQAGFSPALGAFIMGSILAETRDAERIDHLVKPVKDLFAAIFFVSVGMIMDPLKMYEHAGPIALVSVVVIAGKLLSTTGGALLAGTSLKRSVQAGFSVAQIGEFSFIIASLGLSLKVTNEALYPIAVGVSAITTFTTPYLIRAATPAHVWIEKRLPASWVKLLAAYSASAQEVAEISAWRKLVRRHALRLATLGTLITAIFIAVSRMALPFLQQRFPMDGFANLGALLIALFISSPFIWALLMATPHRARMRELWQDRSSRAPLMIMEGIRLALSLSLIGVLASQFVPASYALPATLLVIVLFLAMFSPVLMPTYGWIEKRWMENLTDREPEPPARVLPKLAPWDAHISTLTIEPDSPEAGHSLEELKVRERFGVTIALIQRGMRIIPAPSRHERILPHDKISVIGTDEQIVNFRQALEPVVDAPEQSADQYALHRVRIPPESEYVHRTIRESGIREKTHGLVVGVERNDQRLLNPDSMIRIEADDVLWIVGDRLKMQNL